MDKLPENIYYVARQPYTGSRPYVNKGHIKQSFNKGYKRGRVYRAKAIEWEDVTEEFNP